MGVSERQYKGPLELHKAPGQHTPVAFVELVPYIPEGPDPLRFPLSLQLNVHSNPLLTLTLSSLFPLFTLHIIQIKRNK